LEKNINTETEGYRKSILANGIRVITEHLPGVRSVSVGAWVEAGSRHESDEDAGMCHFIEHMVFKGTRKRRMFQIAERLESVGGYLNAFTTKEQTCFYARALDEHLDRAIDTVCDLILRPTFPEKELEREKDVVVEEMKMYEDSPEDYAFDLLEAQLYKGDPLGRPIIGYENTVRSFTRDRLLTFMREQYTGGNIVIAAAGNVRHNRVLRMVQKAVGSEVKPSFERLENAVQTYSPAKLVQKRPTQQAHLLLGTRAYDVNHEDRAALSVLNTIVGGGMSSLLNQNIREKYGYCYNIYSFCNMHADSGEFGVYMGTDPSKIKKSKQLIFRELNRMVNKEVTPRRLNKAINQVKGSIILGLEGMGSRMMRIARQELYYGRYFTLDDVMDQVNAVTATEIKKVAADVFDPSHFSTVELLPEASNHQQ
jgi:predicted Zn-dependent peptidase